MTAQSVPIDLTKPKDKKNFVDREVSRRVNPSKVKLDVNPYSANLRYSGENISAEASRGLLRKGDSISASYNRGPFSANISKTNGQKSVGVQYSTDGGTVGYSQSNGSKNLTWRKEQANTIMNAELRRDRGGKSVNFQLLRKF